MTIQLEKFMNSFGKITKNSSEFTLLVHHMLLVWKDTEKKMMIKMK